MMMRAWADGDYGVYEMKRYTPYGIDVLVDDLDIYKSFISRTGFLYRTNAPLLMLRLRQVR